MSTDNHEECGHECDHDHDHEHDFVTLTLDDGTELQCTILGVFPVDDKEYIALLSDDEEDDGEIYLYRFIQEGDNDPELESIEDDDEFEAVSDAFDELLDLEEFDEMLDDGYSDFDEE